MDFKKLCSIIPILSVGVMVVWGLIASMFVGNVIPMMSQEGGVMPGKVLEIKDDAVKMDFNHQMAGKDLHFTGEILVVRDATEAELKDGLHGERKGCSGCQGGNCGDGSCGEGCDCK